MYDFAVIDTETTGLPTSRYNRIVEVGVVRLSQSLQVVDEFETLLNPERDIGPTSFHGISARDVTDAPRFADVAGDVLDRINGCVVVAHNAPFDATFLRAEFERVGVQLPQLPIVCTMRLIRRFGRAWMSANLESCCAALGIEYSEPHRAIADARVTAELFRFLVERLCSGGPVDLGLFGCDENVPWSVDGSQLNRSGLIWSREQARAENTGPCQHLSRLVYRLAGTIRLKDVEPEVAGYLDALDHVLEDRLLTVEEAETLYETAQLWNLRPEAIVEAHRLFVRRLADAALADGVVSDAEMCDLRLVNEMLGFDEAFLRRTLEEARRSRASNSVRRESLAGKSVCFTGECICTTQGEFITRQRAHELAAEAGLVVKNSVTKKLDLLVVADPHSASGKAKKARQFGIRTLHEPVFWQMIGISVD